MKKIYLAGILIVAVSLSIGAQTTDTRIRILDPVPATIACCTTAYTLNVILEDTAGNPLAGKQIVWDTSLIYVSSSTQTDSAGKASVMYGMPCDLNFDKSGTIGATFNGDSVYNRSSVSAQVRAFCTSNTPSPPPPTATPVSQSTPVPSVITGDANGDSSVTIVDSLIVAQYYVGLNPQGIILANADVNCSGTVDIVDALLVAQYYVGLITQFSCPTEPSPTPVSTGQYVLHVKLRVYNTGSPSVGITYTGDLSGSGNVPFDIGPNTTPFTVTLTAPLSAFYMGVQPFKFYRWEFTDADPVTSTSTTVTVNDANPERTVTVAYQDESYILTPVPTPGLTPSP